MYLIHDKIRGMFFVLFSARQPSSMIDVANFIEESIKKNKKRLNSAALKRQSKQNGYTAFLVTTM